MDSKGIINYGLSKIGSSRVNSLAPATSRLEKNCAQFYNQWRDSELTKRRWVFARKYVQLDAAPAVVTIEGRKFAFSLPSDYLRAIRDRSTTWLISGRYVLSYCETQKLEYIARVPEADFDPLFVDVLGMRCALENVEYVTQSNTKQATIQGWYDDAVKTAGVNNAFIIGPEDSEAIDELDTWELARVGAWP